jgi:hypothetical protein
MLVAAEGLRARIDGTVGVGPGEVALAKADVMGQQGDVGLVPLHAAETSGVLDAVAVPIAVVDGPSFATAFLAQNLIGQRVEGADAGARLANEPFEALIHFIGALFTERDGEDSAGVCAADLDQVAHAVNESERWPAAHR